MKRLLALFIAIGFLSAVLAGGAHVHKDGPAAPTRAVCTYCHLSTLPGLDSTPAMSIEVAPSLVSDEQPAPESTLATVLCVLDLSPNHSPPLLAG
jgi:hypothetical protein